jgi:hypothetical protein
LCTGLRYLLDRLSVCVRVLYLGLYCV